MGQGEVPGSNSGVREMQIRLISLRLCVVLGLLCVAFARLAMGQSCPPQWTTSGGVPSVNGEVLCSTTLASGAVVVGGTFTEAGGVAASNVAKYDPATRTWSALGTGLSFATVRAVTGLPNGDIIAGGSFFSASGTSFNNIARYSAATSTWVPIVVGGQTGLPAQVNALQGLADGSLVVGGDFLQSTSQPGRYVTILNPAGSAWSALGTGVNASVTGLGVLQSGEILVLGNFTTAGANTSGRVARFNRTSGVWNVLGNWQSGLLYCATQLPGGDVVVGGSFSDAGGTFARNIARYSFASNTWTDLSSGVDNAVYGVVYRAATNDLVVGGSFGNYLPGFTARRIARYSLTDNAWSAIGDGIVGTGVNAISPIASGRVFVGGSFFSAADAAVENCVTLDGANNFVPTGRTTSAAVRTAIDVGNDTLIVGGAFSHANGVRVSRIGRYNAATGAWSSMGAGLSRTTFGLFPTVHAVAQLANGDIIAGGDFVESGAEVVNRIARFRSATGQWEPIGSGTLGTVLALLPLPGSSFLAAGSFNTIGDVSSPAVARFNSGTGSWEPFGSGMPAGVTVRAMVRLTNGDVIATGSGTTALRRYSAATDQWSAVGTISNGFSDSVDSLLLLPTGRVVVGGFFTSIGGLATRNVAVFDPTNSTWSTLGAANAVSGGNVLSLVLDADGNVVLAGSFTQAGGVAANGVARFNVASCTWQTFAPGVQGGNGVAK
ncbi:MAG: hypothetical protein ACOYN0_15600, partial [Phycisphaerales bacterium]